MGLPEQPSRPNEALQPLHCPLGIISNVVRVHRVVTVHADRYVRTQRASLKVVGSTTSLSSSSGTLSLPSKILRSRRACQGFIVGVVTRRRRIDEIPQASSGIKKSAPERGGRRRRSFPYGSLCNIRVKALDARGEEVNFLPASLPTNRRLTADPA